MKTPQKFTREEISLHSSKNDCWLVIHGKVYDVTDFLDDHPGGGDVLLEQSATDDATQAFEDVNHSEAAVGMMDSYFIGYFDGAEKDNANKILKNTQQSSRYSKIDEQDWNFIDYLLPLLILAVAITSWYFLTYYNKAE